MVTAFIYAYFETNDIYFNSNLFLKVVAQYGHYIELPESFNVSLC